MAGSEDAFGFCVASMVAEVLQEHGPQLSDVHTSTKSETKIATKRYEATRWLRKSVGVVAAKDLPAEPSEQNFRMGLRSGLILCSVLNKIEPGAIPKIVGSPQDSVIIPDGPPLSSCPYFENIKYFLLAVEERKLPTFKDSDLEQGGRLSKVVNCVLALKSYSEWKKAGGFGTFKYAGNRKPSSKRKQMVCKSLDMEKCGSLWKDVEDKPIHVRVRDLLSDQKPQDIPMVVEMVLSKLTEDFECKLASHKEKHKFAVKTIRTDKNDMKKNLPAETKPSPRNIFKEMESKSRATLEMEPRLRASFKKDEFTRPFTNVKNIEKEENTITESKKKEETKSFSSIMNEMRKKTSTEPQKPSSDINNEIKKNVTTDTVKPTSDVNKEIKEKATTDTTEESTPMDSISDDGVGDEIEDDISMDPISDDDEDEDDEIEEEDKTMDTGSEVDISEEINMDSVDDITDETEKQKEIERLMELKKKELEKKRELEKKKEMERMQELEKKKEMKKMREMEKKKEMERQAAEDEKEDKYSNWVNAECERLKLSYAKQQRMVEHQHKELQALKNTFSTAKADMQLLRTNYQEEVNNLGKQLLSLAQAAAGYKKVVDENRKLYNQVQDLKGSIRVYCRSRPVSKSQSKPSCVDCIDEGTMDVIMPGKGGKDTRKSFTFNRVFGPTASQALVYKDTQPLIRSVLDGYNVCIFAYGQTGSGKTWTMTGPDVFNEETMGVNYRSLNDLFDIQRQRKDMIAYEVCVQMLEIYNEMVRDLLSTDGASKKLEIRLGTANGINVPDAALVPVTKTEDVIRLMNLGHKNRAVGSTAMNQRSSRSHSCLTVHVSGKDLTSGSTVRGCMHLVDLAGSERADKTEATGDRLKEATFINKSLSALGDVIASLAQKNAHVPYRNSKLTLLLQDALGGQAKTLMFIHVSPDPDTVGETISTLKFAERVSMVELGAAKSNKDETDLTQLKEQVAFLKAALARGGAPPEEATGGGDDDEDGGASECSESESHEVAANSSAVSKLKKPGPVQTKSPQSKASPAAARKPAGSSSPASKTGKTSASDAKKKVGK